MSNNQDWTELRDQVSTLLGTDEAEPEPEPQSRQSNDVFCLRVTLSELPDTIPTDSIVEVEKVEPTRLRFGDVVLIPRANKIAMGRFLRREADGSLQLAKQGSKKPSYEEVSRKVLRARRVRSNGEFLPLDGGVLTQLWNRITRYGTR